MKVLALTAALAASAIALPAAAQGWYDPSWLVRNDYVQVTGGGVFQGRTHELTTGAGLSATTADSLNSDIFYGLEVGHRLAPGVALELEGVYTREHFDGAGLVQPSSLANTGAFRTYGGLANLKLSVPYVDRMMPYGITPYIAGGIGYGDSGYNGAGYAVDRDGFMWQGKAGLEIKTGRRLTWDVGYRYLEAPQLNASGTVNGAFASPNARTNVQAATLGLRFNF